jgi:hypothetical protein
MCVPADGAAADAEDPDTVWRDLVLADARVRIRQAIERAATTVPPFETDTWPRRAASHSGRRRS